MSSSVIIKSEGMMILSIFLKNISRPTSGSLFDVNSSSLNSLISEKANLPFF